MAGCSLAGLAGWGGGHGMFGMLAVCFVLAAAVIYIFMHFGDVRKRNTDRKDSLAILQRRLASGEISPEEFINLKQYL